MLCFSDYVDMGPCVGHMAVMLYVLYELWSSCKFIVHADRPSHGVRDPDYAVSEVEHAVIFNVIYRCEFYSQIILSTKAKVLDITFSHEFW